jgi:COP9 signalosome complex subunit 7
MFLDVFLPEFDPESPEHKLLSIFSYGTWTDYMSVRDELPPELRLDPFGRAAKKLKKLTLLSIFSERSRCEYDFLLEALHLDNHMDMESLVIDLMTAELFDGKLDEQRKVVMCKRCSPRCVENNRDSIMKYVANIQLIRDRIQTALDIANSPFIPEEEPAPAPVAVEEAATAPAEGPAPAPVAIEEPNPAPVAVEDSAPAPEEEKLPAPAEQTDAVPST